MKRVLAAFLVSIAAITLAACQVTPEAPIVVQKDTERMVEQALVTSEDAAQVGASLRELYGIPESLCFDMTGADGRLTIAVDAAVEVSDTPLPIVRVEAAQFSQDVVTGFWKAFLGDTPMIETVMQQTKTDIEQSILYYKQVQAGVIESTTLPEEAQSYIDELEAQYASAPASVEPVPADGQLKRITEDFTQIGIDGIAYYEGIDATSKDGAYFFSVRNDRDNTKTLQSGDGTTIVPVSRGASLFCSCNMSVVNYMFVGNTGYIPVRLGRADTLPKEAATILKVTPAEAAQSVEAFLSEAGIGEMMGISDIYLINDRDERSQPEPTSYAYNVICTRLVSGIPCAFLPNAFASGMKEDERHAPMWGYEKIVFLVANDGILFVNWYAPMKITETMSEATALKPFSEISEIAQKMLSIQYEPDAKDEHSEYVEITIDRIALSLQRVAEQDHFDRGFLVPVWNFFGTSKTKDTRMNNAVAQSGSLLSVNAIDGSIIDTSKGY